MLMHNRPPAVMPRGEQDAAMAAFVLDVLQGADQVRDATEAEAEADHGGPGTELKRARVSFFFLDRLLLLPFSNTRLPRGGRLERGGRTYLVVFPLWYSVLVKARMWQHGQSTGAAPSPRLAIGVAVWYACATWAWCCWTGMVCWG